MKTYKVTDGSIISIEIISVGEMSVGEMSCRWNVRVVGEMSVSEISVGEKSVGEVSGQRNVCRRNLCRRNFCPQIVVAPKNMCNRQKKTLYNKFCVRYGSSFNKWKIIKQRNKKLHKSDIYILS